MRPDRAPSRWQQLLNTRVTRRAAIARSFAAGTLAAIGFDQVGAAAAAENAAGEPVPFEPLAPLTDSVKDQLNVPPGYRATILRAYEDPIGKGLTFGYNADYTAFFPIDLREGKHSSVDGLLVVNHEYPNPLLQHGNKTGPKTPEQTRIERSSLGVSIFRVQRLKDGKPDPQGEWALAEGSENQQFNRRIDGYTTCALTGEARGKSCVFGRTEVVGTVGNCAGGVTPWGTVLSCEENVDDYATAVSFKGEPGKAAWDAKSYGWDEGPDEKSRYVKEHQGWVVEIDPFDPASRPRKHTAMGRFRHENVAIRVANDGRVVAYMGDDKTDACLYKFVSEKAFRPGDPGNRDLLTKGSLFVADFAKGKWLHLDLSHEKSAVLRAAKRPDGSLQFNQQADVLFEAPAAAKLLGATPIDRPEDIEIHPTTHDVYVALTNNDQHGNYHGQIIRLKENKNDPTGADFHWDVFAVGGPQSGFSSPDNLVFDFHGNLWMVTDVSSKNVGSGIYDFQSNNGMFFFPAAGGANEPMRRAFHFASGPNECEMTGPSWTPDGTTLFVSVQHPGEETADRDNPTSTWGARSGEKLPRPAVVAVTGFKGWAGVWRPYALPTEQAAGIGRP